MTLTERYNLIKKICEQKNQTDEVGQLPYTDKDLQDELCRFNTTLEPTDEKWENKFLENLIFGS
jgi:hypothetical protein|tara:strand:+ start:1002 stop:1193 length:192 start_codon:yes stop_codon:yes gene_type:complete